MREIIVAMLIFIAVNAGAAADPARIQSVIDRQIEAFQNDNFASAMEFASPALQQYFRTPEIFGRMVTQGYPMVWRPDSVRYLEHRIENGVHWQRVMITDLEGQVHVLDYRMLQTPDGWRINGVHILQSADFAA